MSPKNTNEQILVVDDDQAIRWTLREALQSWGFTPIEADSVAEAVKHFKSDLPAVVLLDIDLPDGSGLDVLRVLRDVQQAAAQHGQRPRLARREQPRARDRPRGCPIAPPIPDAGAWSTRLRRGTR